jgi:predicted Zn-dependent protease
VSTGGAPSRHVAADRLSEWLSGDMNERDAAVVRAHVDTCAACGDVAADLRRQTGSLRDLARPEPPPTLWPTIAGALEADEGRRWSWPSWLFGALAGASVAACVAWLAIGRAELFERGHGGELTAPVAGPPAGVDPLLAEAEHELDRAAASYAEAARRLRTILDREQALWAPETRARVAERLARLDEAIVQSRAVADRDPGDSTGAEMLFSAYQKQIDFLAEAVHRGSPGLDEGLR